MKLNKMIKTLAIASILCAATGAIFVNPSVASANDAPTFYMKAGAEINIANTSYGGIRWTTVVEQGYQPEANVDNYTFGTLVMPTATYEAVTDGKYINVASAVNLECGEITTTTLTEDRQFYSAISYDDLVAANSSFTDEQLKAAYALELTAVSNQVKPLVQPVSGRQRLHPFSPVS